MPFSNAVSCLFLASESENMPKQKLFFIQTKPPKKPKKIPIWHYPIINKSTDQISRSIRMEDKAFQSSQHVV